MQKLLAALALPLAFSLSTTPAHAERPNIWVISDMVDPTDEGPSGGSRSDPDDIVSMAGLLLSANRFHIEAIVVGSGVHRNMRNPLPFVENVLLSAYRNDLPGLQARYGGFQERIDFKWSSVTRTPEPIKFDPTNDYADVSKLTTVQALVDYAREKRVYVLSWGPLTESAIAVRHLITRGDAATLENLTFISHWTESHIRQSPYYTADEPNYSVANCAVDVEACRYIHRAAQSDRRVRFIELNSAGQSGLVDNSLGHFDREKFGHSRIGQILISAKSDPAPDQSDGATHFLLSGAFAMTLADYADDGTSDAASEAAHVASFKKAAPAIMADLQARAQAASQGTPFTSAELRRYFTYAKNQRGSYQLYTPSGATTEVRDPEGTVVHSGRVEPGYNTLAIPIMPTNAYSVRLDYGDGVMTIDL